MFIYLPVFTCNALSLLLFIFFVNIFIIKVVSSTFSINDYNHDNFKQVEEYIMTLAKIDGIKRSNVCGDGYRIEGAVVKSYPYAKRQTYLPYENCFMTFQARRSNHLMRIHIVKLDLNDYHAGNNCLDSLRFYKSVHIKRQDKLDSIECGQINEAENVNIISPTGIVTIHFSTDGGNVNGLGFKLILTAYRSPNKTHPCEASNDEFQCDNGDCISSSLLRDGVAHCLDGADEKSNAIFHSNLDISKSNLNSEIKHRIMISKHQQWRGILIIAFLLIIFVVFLLFLVYFFCHRCLDSSIPLADENNHRRRRNYRTTVHTPSNRQSKSPSTQVIRISVGDQKHLDGDYNLV